MTPEQVRKIVQEEMRKNDSGSRFGLNLTNRHDHSGGNNGQQISANDVIPSVSVSGNISFAQATTYTLNLNSSFTPSRIQVYGNVTGDVHQEFYIFGSANLGPSFFFQPLNSTSVLTGNVQYPTVNPNLKVSTPLQSSVYFGTEDSGSRGANNPATTPGAFHTLSSENHIVRIAYIPANSGDSSSTIFASATVTNFSKSVVNILVDTLVSGWEINMNVVVT